MPLYLRENAHRPLCIFITMGSNVAIWLANLLLSIRVQTMLCQVMPLLAVKHRWLRNFDLHIVVKKQINSGLAWSALLLTTISDITMVKICCEVMMNIVIDKNTDHAELLLIYLNIILWGLLSLLLGLFPS